MVECDLAKVDVAGSTPVSRSINLSDKRRVTRDEQELAELEVLLASRYLSLFTVLGARYPSGKGEVCKTFMREFDSHPRLHLYSIENKWDFCHSAFSSKAPNLKRRLTGWVE